MARRNEFSEPLVKSIKSAADFKELIRGRSLAHMQLSGDPTAASDSKKAKKREPDAQLDIITDLDEAITAMQVPGTYLWLRDAGEVLAEDVSDLKRSALNHATGVENATTSAMFHDPMLIKKYGPFSLLNNGRGITIYDKNKKAVMEVDGLVLNTTTVLLNECKTALSDAHVVGALPTDADPAHDTRKVSEKGLKDRALAFFRIVNNLSEYTSLSMDSLRLCEGKRIVPVASGFSVSAEAEKACNEHGIELIMPRGRGGTYTAESSGSGNADGGVWARMRCFLWPWQPHAGASATRSPGAHNSL